MVRLTSPPAPSITSRISIGAAGSRPGWMVSAAPVARWALVAVERPGAADLADDPGSDPRVSDPPFDVPRHFPDEVVLGSGRHVRRMGSMDVVAAAHDDLQTGGLGDAGQSLRVAADVDGRDLDQRRAAGATKPSGLLDHLVLDIEAEIVEVVDVVRPDPAERLELDGPVRHVPGLGLVGLDEDALEVDQQVLVAQGHAEIGGRDVPGYGSHDGHGRSPFPLPSALPAPADDPGGPGANGPRAVGRGCPP